MDEEEPSELVLAEQLRLDRDQALEWAPDLDPEVELALDQGQGDMGSVLEKDQDLEVE